jgi:hypothetical protein
MARIRRCGGLAGVVVFFCRTVAAVVCVHIKNNWSFVLSATALIPFLIDDTLEGQYGVVILAFIAFFGQQKLTVRNP